MMTAVALAASVSVLATVGTSPGTVHAVAGALRAETPMTIAVAPLLTERVGLDEVDLYKRLDESIRGAVRTVPNVALQDSAATSQTITDLQQAGLSCEAEDAACLGKVAVLAGVSRIIVPSVRRARETFLVRLLVVDGSGASVVIDGAVPVNAAGRGSSQKTAARGLVERAIGEPIGVVAAPTEAPVLLEDTAPIAGVVAGAAAPWMGIGVLGAGGLLVVAGSAGAIVSELSLATPTTFEARAPSIIAGQIGVAVAAIGVAAAGMGGYLVATTP